MVGVEVGLGRQHDGIRRRGREMTRPFHIRTIDARNLVRHGILTEIIRMRRLDLSLAHVVP